MTLDSLITALTNLRKQVKASPKIYLSGDEEGNSYGDLGNGHLEIGYVDDDDVKKGIIIYPTSNIDPMELE